MSTVSASTDTNSTAGASLVRAYRLGLLYVSEQNLAMRNCDATKDCDLAISSLSSTALLWMAATSRVDSNGLSPLGKRVKANTFEMFRRYFIAANAFRTGVYSAYVAQLRQAITQGAAAGTRLGLSAWFNYMMVLGECSTWRIDLRIPGKDPCG